MQSDWSAGLQFGAWAMVLAVDVRVTGSLTHRCANGTELSIR